MGLKIAQVPPLFESVPPALYGGTERVVSYLTEELVRQGHDVTLFASADSKTSAELVSVCPRALRLDPLCIDAVPHHIYMLEQVARRAHEFDIIHFHIEFLHFPLSRHLRLPQITTLHGRMDLSDIRELYHEFKEMPLVSISNAQRQPLPDNHWVGTVYHGLPRDHFDFQPLPGKYLAFIGRVSPEKGVDKAIEIAARAGVPLKVAAKVDQRDQEYFDSVLRPLFRRYESAVEFLGEVNEREKNELLGSALALLFPVEWPEPFGLVMIEAMACGTPVIAFPRGSVPEVIDHGKTGYIVAGIDEAVRAVHDIARIDRHECWKSFAQRFSVETMTAGYLEIYDRIIREARQAHQIQRAKVYSRQFPLGGGTPPRPQA